jgi:hypothetical protein
VWKEGCECSIESWRVCQSVVWFCLNGRFMHHEKVIPRVVVVVATAAADAFANQALHGLQQLTHLWLQTV